MMEQVARHLESETLRCNDSTLVDVFGRSVFNRYYYATFWIVREALKTIDEKWAEPNHSAVPGILRTTVKKRINSQLRKGVLNHSETEQMRSRVTTSISTLANLLESAYLVRIEADYKPNSKATKEGKVILILNTRSSDAANWPKKAEIHSGSIIDVCKKLGII